MRFVAQLFTITLMALMLSALLPTQTASAQQIEVAQVCDAECRARLVPPCDIQCQFNRAQQGKIMIKFDRECLDTNRMAGPGHGENAHRRSGCTNIKVSPARR